MSKSKDDARVAEKEDDCYFAGFQQTPHQQGVTMIFASLLVAVTMSASPAIGPDPVRLLFLDASSCRFAILQKSLSTHTPAENAQFDADRVQAKTDLEKHAPAAINSAGNSSDLRDDIKGFYAAATAYCQNPSSGADEDYKAKKRALDDKLVANGR